MNPPSQPPKHQPGLRVLPRQDWAWVPVLLGGEAFYQVLRRTTLHTHNPHLLPGMVLMGSLIVPVTFLTYLWGRPVARNPHHVTLARALVAALAGGCVSVAVAAGLEQLAAEHAPLSALAVGLLEEAAKLAVTAGLLGLLKPWTPRDGLLLGAACGAGFAVVETLGYAFADYLGSGGGLRALDEDLLWRSLYSPATHLCWAALTGCALGFAFARSVRLPSVVALVGTFALVSGLHTAWDSYSSPIAYGVLTLICLGLLAISLRLSAAD